MGGRSFRAKGYFSQAGVASSVANADNEARKIRNKIFQYAEQPDALRANVKRLQGRDGYRLRVGDWRVIFDESGDVLDILDIGSRGSIY